VCHKEDSEESLSKEEKGGKHYGERCPHHIFESFSSFAQFVLINILVLEHPRERGEEEIAVAHFEEGFRSDHS